MAHTITLTDNDEPSDGVIIKLKDSAGMDLSELGENAAETTVTVTAELNRGTLNSDVTVTFGALGGSGTGTATRLTDYAVTDEGGTDITTPAAVTISAGEFEASTKIKITPVEDNIDEGTGENIEFTAALTGALTGNATPATLRIDDNDTAFTIILLTLDADPDTLSVDTSIREDHTGEATVEVTARVAGIKTHDTATVVPVQVGEVASPRRDATPSLNATSGDYTLKDFAGNAPSSVTLPISLGSITIPAGMSEATASFKIDPRDDEVFDGTYAEPDEYVRIEAGTLSGFTVQGTELRIVESDNPTITLSVDTSTDDGVQTTVPETAGTHNVSVTMTLDHGARSVPTDVAISFDGMAERGACATAGNDYNAATRTVTIPANQPSHTFSLLILVCHDQVTETTADETIIINGAVSDFDVNGATFTIEDNDSESTSLTITATPSPIRRGPHRHADRHRQGHARRRHPGERQRDRDVRSDDRRHTGRGHQQRRLHLHPGQARQHHDPVGQPVGLRPRSTSTPATTTSTRTTRPSSSAPAPRGTTPPAAP